MMAMKILRSMPLSEVEFVGLEEEDLPRTDEPIDVLACVIDYEMKRLDEIEKAIQKRKEEGFQPPVCEFRGTDASSRRIEKKELKQKREKQKVEKVLFVSVTDRSMTTKARARAKGKRVLIHTMDTGEASSSRFVEDTTNALGKMDIGEGIAVEATVDALENMNIGEGSSSSLLDAQVTKVAESSKSRKRSKKQSKKPEKKPRVEVYQGPDPPPALPDFFQEMIAAMGGVNPVLVLQKALFQTDVANQQNRLSIPVRAVKTAFLTDEEKAILDGKDAIRTVFLDTKGKQWIMPLRLWDMKKQTGRNSSKILALTNPWYKMATYKKNKLVTGDVVQLWAFRISEKLGFALVKLENNRVDG